MNLENIITVCVCLVAIAAAVWFLWNKLSVQQQKATIFQQRLEAIESMFTLPPPPDDLNRMLGSKQHNRSFLSSGRPYVSNQPGNPSFSNHTQREHLNDQTNIVTISDHHRLLTSAPKQQQTNTEIIGQRPVKDNGQIESCIVLRRDTEDATAKWESFNPAPTCAVNSLCGIEPLSVEELPLSKPQLETIADEMLERLNNQNDRKV